MRRTQKAQEQLEQILKKFESGKIPNALASTSLPPLDVPCSKWSLNNRLLVFWAGTQDARGIRQWKEVGRYPKKGSKASYILTPTLIKKKDEEAGEETEKEILTGFRCVPVFRVEDTDGDPLNTPDLEPPSPPPLIEVAEAWGISVQYLPSNESYWGYFSPSDKRIALCTHDEQVFFHELAHAAHEKVKGKLKVRQDWQQEIVAELTATTLMHLYGKRPNDGAGYKYIRAQAQRIGKDVYAACLSVVADTGKCLDMILKTSEKFSGKELANVLS
jgi:hypothetical protein